MAVSAQLKSITPCSFSTKLSRKRRKEFDLHLSWAGARHLLLELELHGCVLLLVYCHLLHEVLHPNLVAYVSRTDVDQHMNKFK